MNNPPHTLVALATGKGGLGDDPLKDTALLRLRAAFGGKIDATPCRRFFANLSRAGEAFFSGSVLCSWQVFWNASDCSRFVVIKKRVRPVV